MTNAMICVPCQVDNLAQAGVPSEVALLLLALQQAMASDAAAAAMEPDVGVGSDQEVQVSELISPRGAAGQG